METTKHAEDRWPPRLDRQSHIATCVAARAAEWVSWWDYAMELGRTPQYNKYKNSCSKHGDKITKHISNQRSIKNTILNQLRNLNLLFGRFWAALQVLHNQPRHLHCHDCSAIFKISVVPGDHVEDRANPSSDHACLDLGARWRCQCQVARCVVPEQFKCADHHR